MAVSVSAGSFRWLLLPIWPQPHRPSDCSRPSSLASQHHLIVSEIFLWSRGATPFRSRGHLSPTNRALGTARWLTQIKRRFAGVSGLVEHARLDAVCRPHSADCMMALPLAACGLVLDNEAVRVAVGLRLGRA